MLKVTIGILVCVWLLALEGMSQQAVVAGVVKDQESGQPIEFATVALLQLSDSTLVSGAASNADGFFIINKIEPGSYWLRFQFIGYSTLTLGPYSFQKGEKQEIGAVNLRQDAAMLDELEVTGEAMTAQFKLDRQVYKASNFANTEGGTAFELLRNMPGISTTAEGAISLRGSTGFILLLNGKPIQIDAATLLAQLPANAIADIEIITAPSARYDADGKAGIINIKMLEGFEDGLFAVVNTRLGMPSVQTYGNAEAPLRYGADFTLNNKSGKWEWSLGANYLRDDIAGQRDGYVSTLLGDTLTEFPSFGERSMERYNYAARFNLTYRPNSKQSLDASFYAGKRQHFRTADILYDQRRTFPAGGGTLNQLTYFNENLVERTGEFLIGSLGYSHTFANKLKISTSALYEFTQLGGPTTNLNVAFPEVADTLQDQRNSNNNPLNGFRFNLDFSRPISQGMQLEWGYQYRYLLHVGEFAFEERVLGTDIWVLDPRFSNRVDLKRHIHALYGQVEGKAGSLDYRLGLRYEYADRALTTGDDNRTRSLVLNSFFPSMNLLYEVSTDLQLKTSYSRRIERTTTFKMNPFPEREHSETLEQGDPDLLPEFVDLLELGVVKYLGDHSFAANLYYQGTRDVINRVNTVFNDSILNRIYTNAGNANAFGVELTAQLNPADWFGFFAGANLYSYRLQGQLFGQEFSTQRPVFSLNTNATFKLPADFNVQLAFNYLSERVTAQGQDSRFYNPSLSIRKEWMGGRFSANLQWLYMDLGLLNSNEQRITTEQPNFFTTTNYIYEVDVFVLNLTYRFTQRQRKVNFLKSEFGDKEF